jgi:hypothetical protein
MKFLPAGYVLRTVPLIRQSAHRKNHLARVARFLLFRFVSIMLGLGFWNFLIIQAILLLGGK